MNRLGNLASLSIPSWNQIAAWLRDMEELRKSQKIPREIGTRRKGWPPHAARSGQEHLLQVPECSSDGPEPATGCCLEDVPTFENLDGYGINIATLNDLGRHGEKIPVVGRP